MTFYDPHKYGSMLSRTTRTSGRKATTDIYVSSLIDPFSYRSRSECILIIRTRQLFSTWHSIPYITFQVIISLKIRKIHTYTWRGISGKKKKKKKNVRAPVLKAEPYITGGFKGMRALLVLFDLSLVFIYSIFGFFTAFVDF